MEVSLKEIHTSKKQIFSGLPETNTENSHLKMDGFEDEFSFQRALWAYFRG